MFLKMPPEIYATSARRGVLDSFVLSSDKGPSRMGVTENQPIKSHRLSAGSSPGWDKGCVTLSKDKHHF